MSRRDTIYGDPRGLVGLAESGPSVNALVDLIAERTAELVLERLGHRPARNLVDATTVAEALGVARSYVYDHAEELGAVRLGDGPKARLRFDLETATTRYTGRQSQAPNQPVPPSDPVAPTRGRRRGLPNGLPEPGSVLTVRPRDTGGAPCR